jgi:Arc/MetJ-type ribon-helix-helix transcriptional regulator
MLNFRAPLELTKALDAWINQQPEPRPSRSEAIRRALADWLSGLGLLKHRDDPEGAN